MLNWDSGAGLAEPTSPELGAGESVVDLEGTYSPSMNEI